MLHRKHIKGFEVLKTSDGMGVISAGGFGSLQVWTGTISAEKSNIILVQIFFDKGRTFFSKTMLNCISCKAESSPSAVQIFHQMKTFGPS